MPERMTPERLAEIESYGTTDAWHDELIAEVLRCYAEIEEREKWLHELEPDHCYGCESPCKYAGPEKGTGAMRCAQCLLAQVETERDEANARAEQAEARVAELVEHSEELSSLLCQADHRCADCGSTGGFKHDREPDTWMAPGEPYLECRKCGSRNVGERDDEFSELMERADAAEAEVERLRDKARQVCDLFQQLEVRGDGAVVLAAQLAGQALEKELEGRDDR